jgi:hypothetical protein
MSDRSKPAMALRTAGPAAIEEDRARLSLRPFPRG